MNRALAGLKSRICDPLSLCKRVSKPTPPGATSWGRARAHSQLGVRSEGRGAQAAAVTLRAQLERSPCLQPCLYAASRTLPAGLSRGGPPTRGCAVGGGQQYLSVIAAGGCTCSAPTAPAADATGQWFTQQLPRPSSVAGPPLLPSSPPLHHGLHRSRCIRGTAAERTRPRGAAPPAASWRGGTWPARSACCCRAPAEQRRRGAGAHTFRQCTGTCPQGGRAGLGSAPLSSQVGGQPPVLHRLSADFPPSPCTHLAALCRT